MNYSPVKYSRGESLWKAFWKGGTVEGGEKEDQAPELMMFPQEPGKVYEASFWGMSFPWGLSIATLLGIAMVFAPGILGVPIQDAVADLFHLAGSLVVVVSVICMGEPLRIGRYLNVLLGLAVAALAFQVSSVSQLFAGLDE